LGFLGPNGAGKTTTLNMLSTLLSPSEGTAKVNGNDIVKEPDAVRRSIGYVFQDPTLDLELTGRENLDFHGRLYELDSETRQKRIKEMLQITKLSSRADDLVKTYSGGMKRRLEIARGLLHRPKVLFLDEPTLGLDPQTRRSIWDYIHRLNEQGKITIILTTHYTEEADFLCNRILIIDQGKVVVLDTPEQLKARLKGDLVSLTLKDSSKIETLREIFEQKNWVRHIDIVLDNQTHFKESGTMHMMHSHASVSIDGETMEKLSSQTLQDKKHVRSNLKPELNEGNEGSKIHDLGPKRLNLIVDNGAHRIPEIVKIVDQAGVKLDSVELREPTLDDVFLSFTGREIRDEKGSYIEMARRFRIMRQARSPRRIR
jgi:ABC-type multidrug transport system ATPase subunit